jgi:hypothetical protein
VPSAGTVTRSSRIGTTAVEPAGLTSAFQCTSSTTLIDTPSCSPMIRQSAVKSNRTSPPCSWTATRARRITFSTSAVLLTLKFFGV